MKLAHCPMCGETPHHRMSTSVVECLRCGTQYVLPAPPWPIQEAPGAIQTLKLNGTLAPPPPVAHVCSMCRHWAGSLSSFQAACSQPENLARRTAFDETCGHWAAGKTE